MNAEVVGQDEFVGQSGPEEKLVVEAVCVRKQGEVEYVNAYARIQPGVTLSYDQLPAYHSR